MSDSELLEQFLQKFSPDLPMSRAREIMMSPHSTFCVAVDDDSDEVIGGILYMTFEECRFSIIGVLGGECQEESVEDVPMFDAIYAPFEFTGATEILKGWWRRGAEPYDSKDAVTPLYIYFNTFKLVDNVLECKEFQDIVAPLYT